MTTRIHHYEGQEVDVTYDLKRCIHAGECVSRLSAVFNSNKRPWVQPDNGAAPDVAQTVTHCPSGALHAERKDGGAGEQVPAQNTVRLVENGPLYIRGDVTVVTPEETVVVQDTRLALCRCGASKNKPFCDNTHKDIHFQASGTREPKGEITPQPGGKFTIRLGKNKSLAMSGGFTILDAAGTPIFAGPEQWLCRCGGSSDKPFCDGTHKTNGFQSD